MTAPVFKTLCGNLPKHPPSEPFTILTHNYYEALGDKAANPQYLESEAAKHYNNITKADGPDITVVN